MLCLLAPIVVALSVMSPPVLNPLAGRWCPYLGSFRFDCGVHWYGLCSTPAFLQKSGILIHARQRLPLWSARSKKAPGRKSLMSFSGRQHFACTVTSCCWRNKAHPVGVPWERTLARLCLVSLRLPRTRFSLCSFCLVSSQHWI